MKLAHVRDQRGAGPGPQRLIERPQMVFVVERADDEPAGEIGPRLDQRRRIGRARRVDPREQSFTGARGPDRWQERLESAAAGRGRVDLVQGALVQAAVEGLVQRLEPGWKPVGRKEGARRCWIRRAGDRVILDPTLARDDGAEI